MRTCLLIVAASIGIASPSWAADPVCVDLTERAAVTTTIVTVGDIARISGGDPATQARIAALDVAEMPSRMNSLSISRRTIEYRIVLAGFDASDVRVAGPERIGVTPKKRLVTAEEVVAAAKAELLRLLPEAPANYAIELTRPVAVQLPEVPVGAAVTIAAVPHARVTGPGRVQMDVAISAGNERLLGLGVYLEARSLTRNVPAPSVVQAAAVAPIAASAVLVKVRQRVSIAVRSGALVVTASGDAMQEGRLGQNILVQNSESKKVLTARVTGPGAVEVELGGVP